MKTKDGTRTIVFKINREQTFQYIKKGWKYQEIKKNKWRYEAEERRDERTKIANLLSDNVVCEMVSDRTDPTWLNAITDTWYFRYGSRSSTTNDVPNPGGLGSRVHSRHPTGIDGWGHLYSTRSSYLIYNNRNSVVIKILSLHGKWSEFARGILNIL